jgi:TonB family protein
MIALLAATLVSVASPTPIPAAQSAASCARESVRIVEESTPTFPENAHPTHARVRYLLDLGSDGRIRRSALVESSGDAAVDQATAKALGEFRFAPPQSGCVSASTAVSEYWDLPPDRLASPSPAGAASALPCAAPFVRPAGFPLPPRREVAGTATVDVSLDATARVTGVQLAQSSGNKKTDYAAAAAARLGRYVFERQPGCTPAATTYRLEMTFH